MGQGRIWGCHLETGYLGKLGTRLAAVSSMASGIICCTSEGATTSLRVCGPGTIISVPRGSELTTEDRMGLWGLDWARGLTPSALHLCDPHVSMDST